MVGELYKTNLGWAVKYPLNKMCEELHYSINIFPIKNQEYLKDVQSGQLVSFSVIFDNKKYDDIFPCAEIEFN